MRHLPSLPGCGQPATVRIEIYSPGPAGNAYGSLDAVAYACAGHQGAVLAMLDDAGLIGHVDPDPNAAPDMGRPCGHLHRFGAPTEPAGPADSNGEPGGDGSPVSVAAFVARSRVPEPGPVVHPRWCTRVETDRLHRSPLFPVGDEVSVQIEQPHVIAEPGIVLRPAGAPDVILPLDVAAALSKQLRIAISLAGMDR